MKNINMQEYETEVLNSDKPVLMDFYADWCGPCRMVAPVMQQLDTEYGDKLSVVKVDVDVQRALAGQFDVMSIPTVVLMKDGKIVDKSAGARPKAYYKKLIDSVI